MPTKKTAAGKPGEVKTPKIKAPKSHKVARPAPVEPPEPAPVEDPRETKSKTAAGPCCTNTTCNSTNVEQLRAGRQHGAKFVIWYKCRDCRRRFTVVGPMPGFPGRHGT
jgi:hypothetical protein